jgi:hypothetical protein
MKKWPPKIAQSSLTFSSGSNRVLEHSNFGRPIAACDEPFGPELTADGLSRVDFGFSMSVMFDFQSAIFTLWNPLKEGRPWRHSTGRV